MHYGILPVRTDPEIFFFLIGMNRLLTSILSPIFWTGLSHITLFLTYRIPAAIPGFQS